MTHDEDYLVAKHERFGYAGAGRSTRLSVMVSLIDALHVPTSEDYDALCMECGHAYPCRTVGVLRRWEQ